MIGRARKSSGGAGRRQVARRVLGFAVVALLALIGQAGAQVDLSVAFQSTPTNPVVGTEASYVVQVSGSGGTNVWVTAVFSLGVQFNALASSSGCIGYVQMTDSAPFVPQPGATVMCPWTGSPVTVSVTPRVTGVLNVVAAVIADQFDTDNPGVRSVKM